MRKKQVTADYGGDLRILGAADGTRTRNKQLGRLLLYQLNYRRDGRGDWIRTSDPLLPKQMRYQTAPHPGAALKV